MLEALIALGLILLVMLLGVSLYIALRIRKMKTDEVDAGILRAMESSGLLEKIGRLDQYARDIRDLHSSLEAMLRAPTDRGQFGEIALETILSNHLPPDMFGMRKKILDGKTPDAYISSTVGLICIDSKFPLTNFIAMNRASSEKEREECKKNFIRDVRGHLEKIREDYIKPDKGSAEFAFAFIPSEGVYWFLVSEAYEMLREFAGKGVQVVSPLTLAHKVELIKAGVHARKLSEEAGKIRDALIELGREFGELDREWRTLYESHLLRAMRKAQRVNDSYRRIRERFDSLSRFTQSQP